MKVLSIECSSFIRKFIRKDLAPLENLELKEAETGREALDVLEHWTPEAITMNLYLEDMEGLDLIKMIRAKSHLETIPVIVITGESEEGLRKQMFEAGAAEFMIKPLPPGKLYSYLSDLHTINPNLKDLKVLLAEDNPTVQKTVQRIVGPKGVELMIAENGQKAWEILKREGDIDLVIMDHVMPQLTGIELAQKIRQKGPWPEVPLIILTELNEYNLILEALNHGVNDYIVKPFSREELLARISNHARLVKAYRNIKEEMHFRSIAESALQDSYRTIKTQQETIMLEMDQARETQIGILPKQYPDFPQVNFAARFIPMEQIGGDFYQIFKTSDSSFGMMLADISGHGISAALISFLVYGNFYASLQEINNIPQKVVETTSDYLLSRLPDGRFATLFYMVFNVESGTLTYTNAAQPAALVLRPSTGEILELDSTGPMLGCFPSKSIGFDQKELQLKPGDKFLLFTDGIIELKDPHRNQMTLKGLQAFLKERMNHSIGHLIEEVIDYGEQYSQFQGFDDDITLLGFEYTP